MLRELGKFGAAPTPGGKSAGVKDLYLKALKGSWDLVSKVI